MAAAPPDSTLVWCLDRLLEADVPGDAVYGLLEQQYPVDGPSPMPITLRCRCLLRALSTSCASGDVTHETLACLANLGDSVAHFGAELPAAGLDAAALAPPADLSTAVKTDLVARRWRGSLVSTPADIAAEAHSVFGAQVAGPEAERLGKLLEAAQNPAARIAFDEGLPAGAAAAGVSRFAASARAALGRPLLLAINDDVNAGRYVPGRAAALVAAPPQARPGEGGGVSYLKPAPGGAATLEAAASLRGAAAALGAAGGADPFAGVYAAAAQAAVAAAVAAGLAPPPPAAGAGSGAFTPLPGSAMPAFAYAGGAPAPLAAGAAGAGGRRPREERGGRFLTQEIDMLVELVNKHGTGAWAVIHAEGRGRGGFSMARTQVDLKDKWRNLLKAGHPAATAAQERSGDVHAAIALRALAPPGAGAARRAARRAAAAAADEEGGEAEEEDEIEDAEEARHAAENGRRRRQRQRLLPPLRTAPPGPPRRGPRRPRKDGSALKSPREPPPPPPPELGKRARKGPQ
jgi:hypothetical protein